MSPPTTTDSIARGNGAHKPSIPTRRGGTETMDRCASPQESGRSMVQRGKTRSNWKWRTQMHLYTQPPWYDNLWTPILLFDEEEGQCVGWFRFTNIPFVKLVLDELLNCLILCLVHRVYLTIYCIWCIFLEFDGMVPCSFWWIVLRFLFAEYFAKVLIYPWYHGFLCVLLHLDGKFCGCCCT